MLQVEWSAHLGKTFPGCYEGALSRLDAGDSIAIRLVVSSAVDRQLTEQDLDAFPACAIIGAAAVGGLCARWEESVGVSDWKLAISMDSVALLGDCVGAGL